MITELIVLFSKIFNYIIDSLVNLNKWKLFLFVKRVVTTNSKCFEYKSFHVSGNSLRISSILIGILYVIETLHINWFLKQKSNLTQSGISTSVLVYHTWWRMSDTSPKMTRTMYLFTISRMVKSQWESRLNPWQSETGQHSRGHQRSDFVFKWPRTHWRSCMAEI